MSINEDKYKNLILYICQQLGGSIRGRKKLFKLLYYIDFNMFEYKESMKTVTGTKYYAWKMGSVPEQKEYGHIIDSMKKANFIVEHEEVVASGYNPIDVIEAKQQPDMTMFNSDELYVINDVIKKYGKLSGSQLEQLTHSEAPWCATDNNDEIPFELALYRGTEF